MWFYCVHLLVNSYYKLFLLEFTKIILIYDNFELDILNQQKTNIYLTYTNINKHTSNLIKKQRPYENIVFKQLFSLLKCIYNEKYQINRNTRGQDTVQRIL